MGSRTQNEPTAVLGHIKAYLRLPGGEHRVVRPVVSFDRLKRRAGAGKGVQNLGHFVHPEDLRSFAIRLLLWAEEIELWRRREQSAK